MLEQRRLLLLNFLEIHFELSGSPTTAPKREKGLS